MLQILNISGASGALRAIKQSTTIEPHTCVLCALYNVVQYGGHVPWNTTLIYSAYLWYWTSCYCPLTPVKSRCLLTSIQWHYYGLRFKRVFFFLKFTAAQILVFSWIAASSKVVKYSWGVGVYRKAEFWCGVFIPRKRKEWTSSKFLKFSEKLCMLYFIVSFLLTF